MPKTINRVELLGRVGVDPEMRYSQAGTAITRIRLATDRHRQNGETETDWHDVICWGKLAEAVNSYVGKGERLYVSGRLAQNSYETPSTGSGQATDGQKRHRTEIHAQEVVFLDSKRANGADGVTADNGPTDADDLPF